MKLKDRLFMSLRGLIRKYKDFILYVLFGVLSTLLNIVSYWFFAHVLLCGTIVSTVIAWILTVFFVYVTNRKWVFHSSATTAKEYVKEIISFFSCRIATGLVDWGCMVVFVTLLEFHDVMIKTLANVLVILLNYVASKLIVFKKK
jgi:putative flippase GtrA